ncbi:MAG: aminotransferase class I/II-fold pyridoxal phosphate-dependent enzyme, partial [Mesorhizobium sp.]
MRFASRTQSTLRSARSSWSIHSSASEMITKGEDVIILTVGDSDFASPLVAVEAISESLARGRTHYTDSAGDQPLREAIARHHGRVIGREVRPDQVVVTIGAQNALLTAALCLLDQGDEVIVPEPMYSTYPGTIAIAGASTIAVPSPAATGFRPSIDAIASSVTPHTRAIFLATPNNPTGAVYRAEE